MLAEWYRYLTTPCPPHLRSLGYLRQLIGLRSRFDRCHRAWLPHLERSKAVILEAAERAGTGQALVLGSGLLLDVPLGALAARFDELVLVDLIHLSEVRREVARFANVRLIELDVTGVVERVHRLGRAGGGVLPSCCPAYFLDQEFDLVVSVNLLSQLPLVPLEYLERKARSIDQRSLRDFARSLILNHLDWLSAFSGVVCLITDRERLVYQGENLVDREDALWAVGSELQGREWIWRIAPRGEIDRRHELCHRVVAVADLNSARIGTPR